MSSKNLVAKKNSSPINHSSHSHIFLCVYVSPSYYEPFKHLALRDKLSCTAAPPSLCARIYEFFYLLKKFDKIFESTRFTQEINIGVCGVCVVFIISNKHINSEYNSFTNKYHMRHAASLVGAHGSDISLIIMIIIICSARDDY